MVSRITDKTEAFNASRVVPEPPEWLTDEAKARFREIASQLDQIGRLAETDFGILARYAATWGRWIAAERALTALGEAVGYARLTDRRGLPASSVALPAQAAASKAHDQLITLERELGLTPRARSLAKTPMKPADDDEGEAFFRGEQ